MLRRSSNVDLVRVQDVGLLGAPDEDILDWAAENNRILLTHDKATIPGFAYNRMLSQQKMCGVLS